MFRGCSGGVLSWLLGSWAVGGFVLRGRKGSFGRGLIDYTAAYYTVPLILLSSHTGEFLHCRPCPVLEVNIRREWSRHYTSSTGRITRQVSRLRVRGNKPAAMWCLSSSNHGFQNRCAEGAGGEPVTRGRLVSNRQLYHVRAARTRVRTAGGEAATAASDAGIISKDGQCGDGSKCWRRKCQCQCQLTSRRAMRPGGRLVLGHGKPSS